MTDPGAHPASFPLSPEPFAPRRRSDDARERVESRGTGIVLAELTLADRPRIAEILRSSRVFRREEIAVALEVFDEGCQDATQSEYLFLGAFSPEGVLVGYACWGSTPATDRTWDLYWIAVDSALQGAGIGTILLEEIERRLIGQHARMLIAETSSRSDYAATRSFYSRRGYLEAARLRDFYTPGDDRIIFVKRFLPLADGRGAELR
jgi:ribosomal protein S18 acetylase RimI-like enzyme